MMFLFVPILCVAWQKYGIEHWSIQLKEERAQPRELVLTIYSFVFHQDNLCNWHQFRCFSSDVINIAHLPHALQMNTNLIYANERERKVERERARKKV